MPDAGPLGETFFETGDRTITGALFVDRSFGGRVESAVIVFPTASTLPSSARQASFSPLSPIAPPCKCLVTRSASVLLEVLHVALVLLRLFHRREGSQVRTLPGFWFFFARIKPILACLQF